MKIVTEANIESAQVSDDGVELKYGDGETAKFDYLAIAAGRGPDFEGLQLDDAATRAAASRWTVPGATSVDGVYAIGDIVHGPALAHKASDESGVSGRRREGDQLQTQIPPATFCIPRSRASA